MKLLALPLATLALSTPIFAQDECASATSIGPGTFTLNTANFTLSSEPWACASGGGPDAWFSFTVGSNTLVTLDLCGSTYDTALEVFDGADCANLVGLACNDDSCGLASRVAFIGTTGQTYLFRVGGFGGSTGSATLVVSATPGGSGSMNDDCVGALPLIDGSTPYSNVGATDSLPSWPCAGGGGADLWYTFNASGTSVDISTCGSTYDTALEVFTGTCGSLSSITCNDDTCGLQSSVGFSSTPGQTYFLRVGGYQGEVGSGTIMASGTGPVVPGTNYCAANPNSTGAAASMSAMGSTLLVDNDLTLMTTSLPPNSFCAYLASQNQGFIPNLGGSMGNLCLAGNVGTFNEPGEIQRTSLTGDASLSLDLTMLPLMGGRVSAMAGESWYFQAWFRDGNGTGATSNLSDGLAVTFF